MSGLSGGYVSTKYNTVLLLKEVSYAHQGYIHLNRQ